MNFLFKNEVVDYDFFNNKKSETVLFLHGWGGNKFSFAKTINLLKNEHNILTITLPTIFPTSSVWTLFDYVELITLLLSIHSIENPIVICHSFGFRLTMLLNKKINISKTIVTGGAGINKNFNILKKITINNNKIILKNEKFKKLFKKIASKDYIDLSPNNKHTFKNIINLNLKFASKLNCKLLLFWGTKDHETPLWIAKYISKHNSATLITVKSDHFAYLNEGSKFNHDVLKFLKNT